MQNESVNDDVFTPASIIGRIFASIVDVVFVAIALVVVSILSDEVAPRRAMTNSGRGLSDLISWASFFVLPVLYLAIMESSKLKATIGKLIIGVKVLDENTFQRIGFFRALGRAIVKVVSVYFCVIGVLLFFLLSFTEKKQAIHDGIFKTVVVDV
jgi:uncharacterized RDD family membrane protein YckC